MWMAGKGEEFMNKIELEVRKGRMNRSKRV